MTKNNYILQLITFGLYILTQILFFGDVVLLDKAFCFIYIGFILLLPIEVPLLNLLLVAFFTGLTVDIFYNSMGMHASSTLLLAFLRPYWISMITPRGGYEEVYAPTIKDLNLGWYTTYAFPLILVHHLALLYIEAGGFSDGWYTFGKVLSSTVFSFIVIVIVQMLFYRRRKMI
jgi:hypothetical protein